MRSHLVSILAGFLIATPALAQGLADYIQQRYPVLQKVSLQELVRDARAAGLVRNTEDLVALKSALRGLRTGKEGPACNRMRLDNGSILGPLMGDTLPVAEVEWNNDLTFAVDLSTGMSATGDNSTAGDVDVFRWSLAAPSFVTCSVVAGAAGPIVDSVLTLLAMDGSEVAFNDDFAGQLSQVGPLYLPPGTYYWLLGSHQGVSGGSYDLVIQSTPASVHPCSGTPTVGTTGIDAWTVTLPSDGVLDLSVVASSSVADLAVALLRTDGTLAYFDDDHVLLNPGLKVGLPAGTYELEVFDIGAGGAEPYTISCTVTPGLLDIGVAGLASDVLLGEYEADLFSVSLTGSQGITFATSPDPASATSIGDTIVGLYDRNFRLVLEIDDSFASGFYSGQSVSLPQGLYYLQVRGFPGAIGDYQLAATVGLPFVQASVLGVGVSSSVVTAMGAASTHRFDVASDSGHLLTMSNDYYAIVAANGEAVVGNSVRSDLLSPQIRNLAFGSYYVLTYDRFTSVGTRTVNVGLTDVLVDPHGDFVGHSKQQNFVILLDEILLTTPFAVHPQVQGLLALFSPVTVGWRVTPANGTMVWFSPRPVVPATFGFSIFLQQIQVSGPNTSFPPGVIAKIGGLTQLR